MSKNVVDVLAEELHRMTNARYAPTQESIKFTLTTHLKPYLEDNKNILCPRVWANFYEGWKNVNSTEYHDILPIWMMSEYMMRRYPKFFLNSTIMTGPTSLVARKDGAKMVVVATRDIFASYDIQSKSNEFGDILEDIQDTRAGNRLMGIKFIHFVNATCDHLSQKWDKVIKDGGMIYPYEPLTMYSKQKDYWKGKIYFKSRYGVILKDQYNP